MAFRKALGVLAAVKCIPIPTYLLESLIRVYTVCLGLVVRTHTDMPSIRKSCSRNESVDSEPQFRQKSL